MVKTMTIVVTYKSQVTRVFVSEDEDRHHVIFRRLCYINGVEETYPIAMKGKLKIQACTAVQEADTADALLGLRRPVTVEGDRPASSSSSCPTSSRWPCHWASRCIEIEREGRQSISIFLHQDDVTAFLELLLTKERSTIKISKPQEELFCDRVLNLECD